MLTIQRLSAGDGYKYLLRHVASGDVDRATSSALTAYYASSGYPPGRWLGTGLAGLTTRTTTHGSASSETGLTAGDPVTEEQMAALFGRGENPLTHELLGRPYPVFRTWQQRVDARIANLNPGLTPTARQAAIEQIRKEESNKRTQHAVAGFDLTFSPVKSVSALWAVADTSTQQQVVAAHHEAINDVLSLIEAEAAHTRTGPAGIAQLDTRGLVAAAFDHWDTRSGDPQLHTHVVVANRVQGPDRRWRSLDGRSLYRACVALSETYNDLLADRLSDHLGVEWDHRNRRARGDHRNPAWEIDGVPDALLDEFSARTIQIEANLQTLIAQHIETTGRAPGRSQIYRLRQQATLMDRPAKDAPRPLNELVAEWRQRAQHSTGVTPARVIAEVVNRSQQRPLTAAQLSAETLAAYATTVVLAVQQRRSTWTRWNLIAEAARQTRALRLASADDRIGTLWAIADHAQTGHAGSITLTPPELIDVPDIPEVLRRRDGESVFTVHNSNVFTSPAILGAEATLLDLAHSHAGPAIDLHAATEAAPQQPPNAFTPSADQTAAIRRIATSGQVVEALTGPAGAGKTTTLATLRRVWEATYGQGSVIGLAPSAAAAGLLGESLEIPTENTTKWIHETVGQGNRDRAEWVTQCEQRIHSLARQDVDSVRRAEGGSTPIRTPRRRLKYREAVENLARARAEVDRWQLRAGQLVIVDEASLADTTQLATLARQVAHAGAKLLLVGDDHQLSAVEAGGAFRLIARDTNAATLTEIWRFTHPWERDASLQLRDGIPDAVSTYLDHGRVTCGDTAQMLTAAYTAWRHDEEQGRRSLLIAADNDTVTALNARARLDRINTGLVETGGTQLKDRTEAGVGDRIVTRLNQRRITTNRGRYIRNGDHWTVTKRWSDGSLTVHRTNNASTGTGTGSGARESSGETVTLPAAYVAESVELGYATTAHRAQGTTVETAHLVVTDSLSRETLYVGMTRGRNANHAYVATANTHDEPHQHLPERTARDVLDDILNRAEADRSAHEVMRNELDAAARLDRLVPIHEHMSQVAADTLYRAAFARCGLPDEYCSEVVMSPAYGPLLATLRRAEDRGLHPQTVLRQAITSRSFDTARDIAAVLHARINRIMNRADRRGRLRPETTIAGLITPIRHIADPILTAALRDTENLIAERANHLAEQAITHDSPWLHSFGDQPSDPAEQQKWRTTVTHVAAYRERYNIQDPDPLGLEPAANDHPRLRDWTRLRNLISASRAQVTKPRPPTFDVPVDSTVSPRPGTHNVAQGIS